MVSVSKMTETIITKANTTTKSLRTTIPIGIVEQFNLQEGDRLKWILVAKAEGKIMIEIWPKKQPPQSI